MMWGYGWGWPGFLWMGLAAIVWLLVLGLIVWAAAHWLRGRSPLDGQPPVRSPSASELLERRYARGEIDALTFEQMRERLTAHSLRIESTQDMRGPTAISS